MDEESILKPIERFLEDVKGTQYEERTLQMKQEVESAIDDIHTQMKADGACEEWLSAQDE